MPSFGCEFEIANKTPSDVARILSRSNLDHAYHGSTHRAPNTPTWRIVRDGSVGGGSELVSPPLTDPENVRPYLDALDSAGARVDRRCGFHVHVEARHLSLDGWKRLLALWILGENAVYAMVSPSRRGNSSYTQSVATRFDGVRTFRDAMDALSEARNIDELASLASYGSAGRYADRYRSLNLCAYQRHGTVEFRVHQGTLSAEKAIAWIRICLRFVRLAEDSIGNDFNVGDMPVAYGESGQNRNVWARAFWGWFFASRSFDNGIRPEPEPDAEPIELRLPANARHYRAPNPSRNPRTQRYILWRFYETARNAQTWENGRTYASYSDYHLKSAASRLFGFPRPHCVREHVAWRIWRGDHIPALPRSLPRRTSQPAFAAVGPVETPASLMGLWNYVCRRMSRFGFS